MKKYCVIIDTYPQTQEEKKLLLSNLKTLKKQGIDVLVTSHSYCNKEIIENSTYFLFEKKNNYYFLDSTIINENIKDIQNPIYLNYIYIGNKVFRDRLVITGWSVAITSQLFNSIKFLYGKGYDYAFYLVSDFICPKDIKLKLEEILENSKDHRNYFIKNTTNMSSWYAGFFFGFTIDEKLISRIPNEDFSENKFYQKHFPNCSAEDVILKIWKSDENYIDENSKLDEIFGEKNWNLVSSVMKDNVVSLHSNTSSSIYANRQTGEFCLMLMVYQECPCEEVTFEIQILNHEGDTVFDLKKDQKKFHWNIFDITDTIKNNSPVVFKKKVICKENPDLGFEDSLIIDIENFDIYSVVKNYEIN